MNAGKSPDEKTNAVTEAMNTKWIKKTTGWIALLFCLALPVSLSAQTTNWTCFAWEASPSPSVVGYRIYFGSETGKYSRWVDVGNVTTACITNLQEAVSIFSVVTCYDATMLESDPSNEIGFQINKRPLPPTQYRMLNINYAKTNLISLVVPDGAKATVQSKYDKEQWNLDIAIASFGPVADKMLVILPKPE